MQKNFKIAIFGGSFNPPTFAHLQMAQYVLQMRQNFKVFFLPCAFRKDKNFFASNQHRVEMLRISIQKYFKIEPLIFDSSQGRDKKYSMPDVVIDTMEINNSHEMIPTAEVLQDFERFYPDHENYMMMGTDLLNSISEWEDYATVLRPRHFIVFDREVHSQEEEAKKRLLDILPNSIYIHKVTPPEISSSRVRQILGTDKSLNRKQVELKKFTVQSVIQYIIDNNVYN